ncbi:hypothetical protein H9643_19025 [Ochrobactrum sp. Sa2BUA5]|nr:hypothetical protein [Ochrobactrum gallinarum]
MSDEITKTEAQIAKDKEAVKAMTGAKAAMEASLRRIEILEMALKSVRAQVENVGKAFGPDVFLNVYRAGDGYSPRKASDLFAKIDADIRNVL